MTGSRLGFAAVTLDRSGGGIAAASRLMWQVVRDRWGDRCRLVTLMANPGGTAALRASQTARVRFGLELASAQAFGQASAVLYSHVSLAKVQNWIPAAFRRPYAVFLHGIEIWRSLSPGERKALQAASLLIANSSYTVRRVKHVHPWIGPIAECPLALPDSAVLAEDRDPARPRERPATVIIVARMSAEERYKGHDQVLEAWPAVRAQVGTARLIVVGDGDDVPRLKAKASSLALGDSVVFAGFVSDRELAELYRQSAVFAMPSREEGFGLVYLEAMANGLPCIGSVHDAAGGVIVDGLTGYLIDQADVAGLADRLVRLLSNDALRAEMGAQGQRRVEEQFTYGRFRDRLLSLLEPTFEAERIALRASRSPHVDAPPRS
jgi:phosphatidylinositol alpha-1,6-mannosyltransferase